MGSDVVGRVTEPTAGRPGWLGHLWKVPVAAVVYVVGSGAAGAALGAAGVKMPDLPKGVDMQEMGKLALVGALLLAAALMPVAQRLRGSFWARWLGLAAFVYVALGLNTAIEAAVFTTMGGFPGMVLMALPPVLLSAACLVAFYRRSAHGAGLPTGLKRLFGGRTAAAWAWRLALAWASFIAAYYLFGMLLMAIVPWGLDLYRQQASGLRLPAPGQVIAVQMLRSLLFLASALPLAALWAGKRGSFALWVGLAYWVSVGVFGLVQGVWMPAQLRLAHGIEIGADSFAYAVALAWLLLPGKGTAAG